MNAQYAVMGNPINHSKSPQIHQAFAAQTDQAMEYRAIYVELTGFDAAVREFFSQGGSGLNVTVPFKEQAWALAQIRTPRAEQAGAVNTLYLDEQGQLVGDNTDGVGLVRDLTHNYHQILTGQRILLLGAGGAARGVIQPLLAERPQALTIANRTYAKAAQLAEQFASYGPVSACELAQLVGPFDLIINATAASLQGQSLSLPATLVQPHTVCYDMMYGQAPTPFCCWAKQQGAAQAWDGLGMLVEQAAAAFTCWRGVRPDSAAVIAQLRTDLLG